MDRKVKMSGLPLIQPPKIIRPPKPDNAMAFGKSKSSVGKLLTRSLIS